MTKLILDVDTGLDDALALMIAALSPEIELIAATTVNGNLPVPNCTENTLRVFDYLGVNIPVYEGMSAPLVHTAARHAEHIHGAYVDLPEATSRKQAPHAVEFLIDTYMGSAEEIVLAPVGPLTNVAMMLRLEPRVRGKIAEMVIMGGGHAFGNVTPAAEFNIWCDAEAARVVLQSGIPIRLIPLDATHQALITGEHLEELRALGTPAAQAAALFAERLMRVHAGLKFVPPGTVPMHDSLAVCAILEPSVVSCERAFVDVETSGQLTYGRTVMDFYGRSGQSPNCQVALSADAEKYIRILMGVLGKSVPSHGSAPRPDSG